MEMFKLLINILICPPESRAPLLHSKEPKLLGGALPGKFSSRRGAATVQPRPQSHQSGLDDMPQPLLPASIPRAWDVGSDPASVLTLLRLPQNSTMRALCFDFLIPARRKRI